MSKVSASFCAAVVTLIFAAISAPIFPQDVNAAIDIDTAQTATAHVRGKFSFPDGVRSRRNFSFLRSIAGIDSLAGRVSDLNLYDANNKPIAFRKLVDGEYLSEADMVGFSYKVDISVPKQRDAAAHTSWIAGRTGILMLADLLPQVTSGGEPPRASITVSFVETGKDPSLGPGLWPVVSTESRRDETFTSSDTRNAVLYVGTGWDKGFAIDRASPVQVIISGDWNFEPDDAVSMAGEIYNSYQKLFRGGSDAKPLIAIAKFPQQTAHGQWQAETRGRSVTILSSDMPFRTQSLQRLHEQLRHELFHLWIPNGVALTGNYDWFYEGFALYQSLKLAVGLNRIRFEDFLDTLSRAHTIDSAQFQRTSLVQASTNRFKGSNTQVYVRGMLVAFLCDLALLNQSKGRRSVEDVLAELFGKHRKPATPVDGNTAVLALLRSNPGVVPIVEKYVSGSEKIDWTSEIATAGIEDSDAGILTSLRVKEKPTGRQKALLDKLGYNNWRKLAPTSK